MCGILGSIALDPAASPPAEDVARRALSRIRHRGPDGIGLHRRDGVLMGHTRLALVDLHERSNQPFLDPTGRYALVFNGELYDFRQLRAGLERRGIAFRTTSDTEVLLHALIRSTDPAETLAGLTGMFALAFHDFETGRTLLARDRYGKKPLFWGRHGGCLHFASAIAALQELMPTGPDMLTAAAYLMGHGGPMRGATFFAGVTALPPGHMMTLERGQPPAERRFAEPADALDPALQDELAGLSPEAITDRFEELLDEAVRSQLMADATVGAFCSGGVDSSLIVALACRQDRKVPLFHANVTGAWSEADAARALADHLGMELHAVDVTDRDFLELMPRVTRHYEQPFSYHPNCAPLMLISQKARDTGVKALLSGEGSDELFLGYPWLGRRRLTDAWDRLRGAMGRTLRAIPEFGPILLPDALGTMPAARAALTDDEMAEHHRQLARHKGALGRLARDPRLSWSLEHMNHHLRTLLHRNDTMGMSASIEARFPFLDNRLVAHALNLPGQFKLRRSLTALEPAHPFIRDKWVVRAIADRHIPAHLSRRKKLGFWTTAFARMRVDPTYFAAGPLLDALRLTAPRLDDILARAPRDFAMRLLHLDIWMRSCLMAEPEAEQIARLDRHVTQTAE